MVEAHVINIFDAIVVTIMLLSCVFAFYRGFVREVLSLSAWVGAGIVTLYYFQAVADKLHPYFKKADAASAIGALALFVVALIAFSLINTLIMKFLKSGTDVGMLDNLFGLVFGLARGVFVLSLGYFLLTIAIPDEKQYPLWLQKSMTRPYIEKGAIELARVAPDYLREISSLQKKAMAKVQAERTGSAVSEPADEPTKEENTGYKKSTASQMDRLIDSNEKN